MATTEKLSNCRSKVDNEKMTEKKKIQLGIAFVLTTVAVGLLQYFELFDPDGVLAIITYSCVYVWIRYDVSLKEAFAE